MTKVNFGIGRQYTLLFEVQVALRVTSGALRKGVGSTQYLGTYDTYESLLARGK